VIVRILSEGQFRLDEGLLERVNALDNDCVAAVADGDEERFRNAFQSLVDLIHSEGERLPDDDLSESDVLVPPADLTLEEAQREFTGAGLIPD
jgi:hypothetical protein